jgi:hypothetical protein
MNNLQQELQEMFRRRETDMLTPNVAPPPGVRRRVRARQIANVAVVSLAVGALVGGSILGFNRLAGQPDDRVPIAPLPEAPEGWRAVALPRLSISYPENWYLLAREPEPGADIAQLTNFDPGLAQLDCDTGDVLPGGGVMLTVQLGAPADVVGVWPATLGPVPGAARPCGADQFLAAEWTNEIGLRYSANAFVAADVRDADVKAIRAAFDSMTFPQNGQPQMDEPLGAPALILESADSLLGPMALYLFADEEGLWLGVMGPTGFRAGATDIGRNVPVGDEGVTMVLGTHGGVIWGTVTTEAVRAELFTVEGETFPAELVPLPASAPRPGVQAVWGFIEGKTRNRVATLLYNADGNVLNPTYPIGPDVTIAEGTHPEGGPWRLFITTSNDGAGLSFAFEEHGAGGGCCMSPLGDRDLFQVGWSSSSDRSIPRDIEGLASTKVARVEYVHADGRVFEGALYPIPDRFIGPANALLILVPGDVRIDGRVVAYDSSGAVLATQHTGPPGEPPGPTPEIDAVWTALRAARDAVSRYLREAGTLVGMTPEDMAALLPDVTFNASDSAVPNEVSLRGATEREIAFVSTTQDGDVYCIAVEATEGGGNYGYGRQDAASPEECGGGWG